MWNRLPYALIFLALLYSGASVADAWSAYAVDEYGTFYFFVAEPQQPDGVTLVKDLASYRRDGKNGAKSEQTLLEVDCVSQSIREHQHTLYAEPMRFGTALSSTIEDRIWQATKAGSIREALVTRVCTSSTIQ